MLFNAKIIFHELQKYMNVEHISLGTCSEIRTSMFYNRFFQMDHNIVLVHAEDLSDCISRVNNSILICMEKPEVIPEAGTNDLLIINDEFADLICYNIINHIIGRHMEWESQMNDVLYNKGSIHDLINLISDLLDTPVSLIDPDMQYISYSDSSSDLMNLVDENDRLPIDHASSLLSRPDFHQLEKRKEAFLYIADKKCVYKNIYYNNNYIARLASMIDNLEDVDYHKAIFDQVANYIEILYQQYGSFDNKKSLLNNFHLFLKKLLNNESVNFHEMDIILNLFGAREDDRWDISVIIPTDGNPTTYGADYICSQIEHLYHNTIAFYLDGEILVFRNRSLSNQRSNTNSNDAFLDFIPSYCLKAGISRIFQGLSDTNTIIQARHQAQFAVYYGIQTKHQNIHLFNDCALDYILQNDISMHTPEQLYHPALLYLQEYDGLHATNYFDTVREYVNERYNAVSAAKKLYLHRTSFINRMNRIKDLTNLDFDSPKERLYLEVSLYLYQKQHKII